MVFSAHKIYAPFGTGVLIARKGLLQLDDKTNALLNASALENAGGIAALGKAILLLNRIGFEVIEEEEKWLRAKALQAMAQIPGVKLHGVSSDDLLMPKHRIGVIGFDLKDKMSSGVAGKLARRGGIGVRFGCLCAHLIIKQLAGFTPFQEKMQRFVLRLIPIINLQGITRVSFGIQNTEAEVESLIHELKEIAGSTDDKKNNTITSEAEKYGNLVPDNIVKQQIKDFIMSREFLVYG
jgi:selenocysteine lyase/cysteine desulfurase